MAQIGTLVTGAGITTVISGQAQAEQFIVLGDVDTANPLTGLQVEINGTSYFSVVNQAALLSAYAKWMVKWTNTIVGVVFKIATGRIGQNTTYRFTNGGATTPIIYAYSDNGSGIPFVVSTVQVNASSYQDFDKFSALFIGTPANVSNAEVQFANGFKTTMTVQELGSYFAMKRATEADGYLAAVTVVDNTDQTISSIRMNCSAATTFLVAKIPDAAFKALTGK